VASKQSRDLTPRGEGNQGKGKIRQYSDFIPPTPMWESVKALKEAAFRKTDISVLMPENVGTKGLAHEKNTKASQGRCAGGDAGLVLGGHARLAGGTRLSGDTRTVTVHSSGTHYGDAGGRRPWYAVWYGYPGI
jgi:hypothetical protein